MIHVCRGLTKASAPGPRLKEHPHQGCSHARIWRKTGVMPLLILCCMKISRGRAEFPDDGNPELPPTEETQRQGHKDWADVTHRNLASQSLPSSYHTVKHHLMTGRVSEKCVTWQFHHCWDQTVYLEKSSLPFCVIRFTVNRMNETPAGFPQQFVFEANYFWAGGGHPNDKTQCNKYTNQ